MAKLIGAADPRIGNVLLFCLLTGMRAGEAVGLIREDLVWKGNLGWFAWIRPNEVRALKTDATECLIPLHSALTPILEELPRQGRLFPDLTVSVVTKRFAALAVDPRALQSAPTECIVLNDDAGRPVEYEDTEETRRMREELTAYNELLARSFIDIPALEDPWIVRQDNDGQDIRVGISPRYQHVRRIFSRNSWEMNGRFYGPWWQGLNSEWRSQIFINDTPTVEIDFKAMHPKILAAQRGVELPNDPYALPPGQFPGVEAGDQRGLVKQLVLTALNARDVRSACAAFREDLPTTHPAKRLPNRILQQVIEELSGQVPALADSLCSDAGIRLMYTDSRIIEQVINHFTRQELPVLTVHDSVIAPYTHSMEVQAVMRQAAAEVVGRELPVESEHRGLDEWQDEPRYVQKDFQWWRETERGERYLERLTAWETETGREVVPYRLTEQGE